MRKRGRTSDLKPGDRVTLLDNPEVGIVIAVREGQVKAMWPNYRTSWHDIKAVTADDR